MGKNTKIEWAHHTFNPWWGCAKVSPACKHCYAEGVAGRFHKDLKLWGAGDAAERKMMGAGHWVQAKQWDEEARLAGVRRRVFCGSMCDVMEDRDDVAGERLRLFSLIESTPNLDWLLLTKRPENFRRFLPMHWIQSPRPNVWGMTTVESQEYAWRAVELLKTPFAVRGLSCEPLLGSLDLQSVDWEPGPGVFAVYNVLSGAALAPEYAPQLRGLDFVIAGGETGAQARPMSPNAVRWLRNQCVEDGVRFFFKQWGNWAPAEEHDFSDGVRLIDRDGRDVTDLPEPWDADTMAPMVRMPKEKAGRLLDGREWNELPEGVAL